MEFDEIYRVYFNDVYRYLLRLSGNEHMAEEITSDTFFKAMRSIKSFRGDCDLRVWLCQIAKNSFYTYVKKHRKTVILDEEALQDLPVPFVPMEEAIGRQEDLRQIQKTLHTLPEPYKEVFMWRVYAELSFKQIGEMWGKSDNWACVTYHRARKMIQDRWEESNHERGM